MKSAFVIALCFAFGLAGCGPSVSPSLISSEIVKNQTQRFQFKESTGGYPAIIFDSVSGCVKPVFFAADEAGSLRVGKTIDQYGCDNVGIVSHDGVK